MWTALKKKLLKINKRWNKKNVFDMYIKGKKFVYISTDYLTGKKPPYFEDSNHH